MDGEKEKGEDEKDERVEETRREMRRWHCLISWEIHNIISEKCFICKYTLRNACGAPRQELFTFDKLFSNLGRTGNTEIFDNQILWFDSTCVPISFH